MPKISVIVPVYRVEEYLSCCVDSILAQTYPDFELILVDDGSPDQSGDICDAYAAKDPRVVVIHKENGGVSSARNLGLDRAKGEYITFVDSDDWLAPDFLRVGIDECISQNIDLYCSGATRVWSDGKQHNSLIPRVISGYTDMLTQEELIDLLHKNYAASSWGKLIRREVIADLRFDNTMNWGEDLKWVFTLLKKHIRIYAVPKVDYYYRVGDSNSTGTVNLNKCKSFFKVYSILYREIVCRAFGRGAYQEYVDRRCFADLIYLEQLILCGNVSAIEKYKMLVALYEIQKLNANMCNKNLIRHLWYSARFPFLRMFKKMFLNDKDMLYPLRRLHGFLHEQVCLLKLKKEFLNKVQDDLKKNPDSVFLLLTPDHGNLGDQAIALSETALLKRANVKYIEITEKWLFEMNRFHLLNVMDGHTILFNGGGYLGTLWYGSEYILRRVIQENPKSTIVLLPNSIYYEDSEWGKEELEKSVKLYNTHENLHIYARERLSFDKMKSLYKSVKLMPDMVLSLDERLDNVSREGCLLCLRSDDEKTRTEEDEQILRSTAKKLFGANVRDTDMVIDAQIAISDRANAVRRKLTEFSGSELVITDRLHAMIFCALTGTPCIVVASKSPKMRGCYEWIKDLEYIHFVGDVLQIEEAYMTIPKKQHYFDNGPLQHYYTELVEDINFYKGLSGHNRV